MTKRSRIAFFSPHLEKIGETHALPALAQELGARGWAVDFIDTCNEWQHVPSQDLVRRISLRKNPWLPKISWLPKHYAF